MPTSEEATRLLQLSRDAFDRGDAVHDVAVTGHELTGDDHDDVAHHELGGRAVGQGRGGGGGVVRGVVDRHDARRG